MCITEKQSERRGMQTGISAAVDRETKKVRIFLPTVSYGSAPFSGEDIAVVKDRADRDMYQYKKGRKKHCSSGVLSK